MRDVVLAAIALSATVTGKDGRSIDDLRKEDFALFDGGKPHEIATFTRVIDTATRFVERYAGANDLIAVRA